MNISNDTLPRCAENDEPVEPIPVIPFKCEPVMGMRARLNLAIPENARRSRPNRAFVWALAAFGIGVLIGAVLS